MADLWGALEETEPVETLSVPIAVALPTPDTVVVKDLITHDKIRSETDLLRTSMACSSRIVVAAYKVADYVPNLQDSKHREFWKEQVCFIYTILKSEDNTLSITIYASLTHSLFCSFTIV